MYKIKKNKITQLKQFHSLLCVGFNSKQALLSLISIYKTKQSSFKKIYNQVKLGMPIQNSIIKEFDLSTQFHISHSTISLHDWLFYQINDYEQKSTYIKTYAQSCAGLFVYFCISSIITCIFLLVFIPKTTSMLQNFNIPIPLWLLFISNTVKFFLQHIFLILICLGICCVSCIYSFKQSKHIIFKYLYNIMVPKTIISIILYLLKNNLTLKKIAQSLKCPTHSIAAQSVEQFKYFIIKKHCYRQAFSSIIDNSTYMDIISQSIESNQIQIGLEQISNLYKVELELIYKQISSATKLCLIILIAIQIMFCFYISMAPMNQLLRRVTNI